MRYRVITTFTRSYDPNWRTCRVRQTYELKEEAEEAQREIIDWIKRSGHTLTSTTIKEVSA